MNYQETVEFLYSKLPMFSRQGTAAYKKDLHNTIALLESLDHPERKFKSVHIAGTNGKGSSSHLLAAIFQSAGYKTGLYTSPHLYDFRERIKINGDMVSEDFVIEFVQTCLPTIEKIEPSFFEVTVAMAFAWFAKQQVDIAIIEVGLGGRLDSTNVITPEISVITQIGKDHMNMLGNTLSAIAFEKAGIIKQGVPVVIGEIHPETKPVFEEQAQLKQASLLFAEDYLPIIDIKQHSNSLDVTFKHSLLQPTTYTCDLPGWYQARNMRTVLTTTHILRELGWNLHEEAVRTGLSNSKSINGLMGRWEVLQSKPTVIADVGHNEDGIKVILEQLSKSTYKHLHIVFGMAKDKEIENVLQLLPKHATYYFTQASIPRALDAHVLREMAVNHKLEGTTILSVNQAFTTAMQQASKDDLILVCGSIFIVAEIDRSIFQQSNLTATAPEK
jgi:dihydrofolate synthase/folylpolyglutamate synthase